MMVPVACAAWFGGVGVGAVVALAAVTVIDYFFISSERHLAMPDRAHVTSIASFLIFSIFISFLIHLLQTARDKAEQEKELAEKHLKRLGESDRRFRRIVESDMIGIIFFRMDGRITDANDAFLEMLGYSEKDLLAGLLNWKDLTPPEWARADTLAVRQMNEGGVFNPFEKEFIAKDESRIPIYLGGALFEGSDQEGVAYVLDISQRKSAENMVRHQAFHDALTGLPNRILLKDRLVQMCNYAKRNNSLCAVLMLDLDNFKVINDTLGHPAGDELLKDVAKRLQECVREEDTVARFGGDEFVVAVNQIQNHQDVLAVIDKIFSSLELPMYLGNREVYVNTSVGVVLYPQDGEDEDTLIKHADIALYQAKEMGRKTHFFFSDRGKQKEGKSLTLDKELRKSLKKGEFILHYQPIVDIKSHTVVSAESLVRWRHPKRGLLLPQHFISYAEETGLIYQLGEWIISSACQQLKNWEQLGLTSLPVTINISPAQFYRLDFLEHFKQILATTGVNPHSLVLEITENLAMRHIETAIVKLGEIREMGVKIVLDDFGIGHSSLNYLKHLPVDKLKIDKSFIQNSPDDEADTAIIKAIFTLAHNLKIDVIAEGVENERQLQHLVDIDCCDEVQGFLVSKALPSDELQKFVLNYNALPELAEAEPAFLAEKIVLSK